MAAINPLLYRRDVYVAKDLYFGLFSWSGL